jgi:hypothetical protein
MELARTSLGRPKNPGPITDLLRPGIASVTHVSNSFFLGRSKVHPRGSTILSFLGDPSFLDFARPPALCGNGRASLTGFSRANHAWDRLSAGTPAHAVTAVTAVPRRYPATACRSLGGHGPAVTAATAVTVGIHIARAVTTVIIVPAVIAVTLRAFVTRPGGHGPPWAP